MWKPAKDTQIPRRRAVHQSRASAWRRDDAIRVRSSMATMATMATPRSRLSKNFSQLGGAARARPRSGDAEVDVAAPSGAQTLPTGSRRPAGQPQRVGFAAETAIINRERWKSIREEVGTSRSSPLVRALVAGWQRSTSQRPPAPQTLPTASRCPARAVATGQVLAAGTATFNRETRRISREEVGTSCSSLLVRARVAGWQRSTSHRSPAHCLPTA